MKFLYHATFRANLADIKKFGLGAKQRKNWDISVDGYTYFSESPDVAFSYCEAADDVAPSKYDSGIVVLAVPLIAFKQTQLCEDRNVKDQTNSDRCIVYGDIVDPNYIFVVTEQNGIVGKLLELKRVPAFE